MKKRYTPLILLIAVILSIFIGRTLLAHSHNAPRLFDLFGSLTMLGALWVLVKEYRRLRPSDWLMALGLGIMRERAESIGASLHIRSAPEQGTTITLDWKPSQQETL